MQSAQYSIGLPGNQRRGVLAEQIKGRVEFFLGGGRIAAGYRNFGDQFVRDGDILAGLVMCGDIEQLAGVFICLIEITLRQPVFASPGLKANVVAPAEPGVTLKDRLRFAKSGKRLIALPGVIVIDTQVDEGIGLGFQNVMLAPDLQSLLVVLKRVIEIL